MRDRTINPLSFRLIPILLIGAFVATAARPSAALDARYDAIANGGCKNATPEQLQRMVEKVASDTATSEADILSGLAKATSGGAAKDQNCSTVLAAMAVLMGAGR